MGNQPSSPNQSVRHSRSRSRSSTPYQEKEKSTTTAHQNGSLRPHRSMRRKTRSIELPDLLDANPPRRAGPLPQQIPINHQASSSSSSSQHVAVPIPIGSPGGLDHRQRTDSEAERLIGGDYGLHIPADLRNRATTSTSERRPAPDKKINDHHRRMESLLAQTALAHRADSVPIHNPNELYRQPTPPLPPSPSIASPVLPAGDGSEVLHSKLRFGLDRYALMRAGLMVRSETFEASLASLTLTPTPESETIPETGYITTEEGEATTPVPIKWTEGGESVILCLYSAGVVGLGLDDVSDLANANLDGEESEGMYVMDKVDGAHDGKPPVFKKVLNLGPGTHHMRFLVSDPSGTGGATPSSNTATSTPSIPGTPLESPNASTTGTPAQISPTSPSKYGKLLVKLSTSLPTSPDPSGALSNYVVVAPAGAGAVPSSVTPTWSAMQTPRLQIPVPLKKAPWLREELRHREPGQSFWSKDSEADEDDHHSHDGDHEHHPEAEPEIRKEVVVKWTSEIPEELIAAAKEEEEYLEVVQQSTTQQHGGTTQMHGFTPAPPIPPAPQIPRHLDKLILNYRPPANSGHGGRDGSPSGSPTRGGHHRERDGGSGRHGGHHSSRTSRLRNDGDHHDGSGEERRAIIPVTTASGTDVTATALLTSTANAAMALTSASSFASAISASAALPHHHPNGRHRRGASGLSPSSATHPSSSNHRRSPSGPNHPRSTEPFTNTGISDDSSVLPVPSHVVLNHLSTSAIRNGVIAVGGTIRYREKYLTSIYYKPTPVTPTS